MFDGLIVRYGTDGYAGTLELLDRYGAASEIDTLASYAIKPNLVAPQPCSNGATTSPEVVRAIVEFLLEHGVRDISIMEGAAADESTRQAWEVCGYLELASRYNVPLIDLKSDRTRKVTVDDFTMEICQSVLDTDYLINVPVLKGHCQTVMTCALKNLKGCISDAEKRRFHTGGLHRPIALLNRVVTPWLTVVDSLCGDLTYELGGNPIRTNRLIIGSDPVMIDSYCADLMGIPPEDVTHLKLAERCGVGAAKLSGILELGHDDSQVDPKSFSRTAQKLIKFTDERQACSACYASLIRALHRLEEEGLPMPKRPVAIGQAFAGKSAPGLGVGICTTGFECNVPGCPPTAADILKVLKEGRY